MQKREEGFVLVALMALSTVIVVTMLGTACVVGCKHYKHNHAQEICAQGQEYDADNMQQKARALCDLV